MFILKKGHQPGVYVPLRALFLVFLAFSCLFSFFFSGKTKKKYIIYRIIDCVSMI